MIKKSKEISSRPAVEMVEGEIVEIERKIRSGENRRRMKVWQLWGGADVIIELQETERTRHFLGTNQPHYINGINYGSARQVVITKDARELSWLFEKMRDVFRSRIDYLSKYEFFGALAETSNEFIKKYDDTQTTEQLLLHVLETPKKWLNNIKETEKQINRLNQGER
jgi:hypothetical protein